VITVNACTGVTEQSLLNGISIYPNPNNGIFTIAVNSNVGDLTIVITDLQGRVVYSSTEKNVTAGYTQQIDLQSQAGGIYLLQISGNGEQRVDKITVQK
jgi:extracellular elastinolytic metalloproteinase